jgi:hypothetical protein
MKQGGIPAGQAWYRHQVWDLTGPTARVPVSMAAVLSCHRHRKATSGGAAADLAGCQETGLNLCLLATRRYLTHRAVRSITGEPLEGRFVGSLDLLV